jgi:uncharacterized protein
VATLPFRCALIALAMGAFAQPAAAQSPKKEAKAGSYPASAASFDCGRAAHRVETMICNDELLPILDGILGDAYQRVKHRTPVRERAGLLRGQRAWLDQRNSCRARDCVADAYERRLTLLEDELAERERRLRAHVAQVGQCQVTRIERIGPRLLSLGSEYRDGTHVSFANGVHQVSYDRERPVFASRVGDRARVCLVSIPANCPPGDDRGRVYEVSNVRTGGRWRLPDASHRCGGA